MKYYVIGVASREFESRDKQGIPTGKMVRGVQLFCARPFEKNGVGYYYGKNGDKLWLSEWFLKERLKGEVPSVGDLLEVGFNQYGKLDNIQILEHTK